MAGTGEAQKIHIIGINGAPWKRCRTVNLLRESLQAAERTGATTKIFHLTDWITEHFDGRRNNRVPRNLAPLFREIRQADGIIVASPTYWLNMTDRMMTFFSYLGALESPRFELKGKPAACIAACEEDGGQMTAEAMGRILTHMGCGIVPFGYFFRNKNMADKSEHQWQMRDHRLVGKNVAMAARCYSSAKGCDWNDPNP